MKRLAILMLIVAISLTGCSLFDKDKDETTTTVTNPGNDPGQMSILNADFYDDGSSVFLSGSAKNVGQGKCTDITLWVTISNTYGAIWYDSRVYPECLGGQTITYNGTANIGASAVQAGYNVYYEITYYYYNNSGSLRKVGK